MKIQCIFLCLIILLTILFSFTACEPVQSSVFRAIINAKPEQDNTLNNYLSIIGIADDNINYYLAAGFSMWRKSVSLDSVVWDKVEMAPGAVLCTAFILSGAELYAGFQFRAADNTYTYSLWKGGMSLTPAWQQVPDALIDGKQITKLFSVNGVLFANTLSGASYTLYYLNGANFAITGVTDITSPVTSISRDGTAYWAVSGNGLYKGSTPGALAAYTTVPEKSTGDKFNALFFSSQGKYYLALSNGLVYSAANPDTGWTASPEQKIGTKKVYFTEFAEINSNILIGTMGYGFYQTPDGDIAKIARYTSDQVSEIMQSSIMHFYTKPADNLVFFLTGSNGLYRNACTIAGGWQVPVHE